MLANRAHDDVLTVSGRARETATSRSVITLGHHDWPDELVTDALHAFIPRATPRPPDLELYSPN
jgi:hypothetical protein